MNTLALIVMLLHLSPTASVDLPIGRLTASTLRCPIQNVLGTTLQVWYPPTDELFFVCYGGDHRSQDVQRGQTEF